MNRRIKLCMAPNFPIAIALKVQERSVYMEPLLPEEFVSLKEVSRGLASRAIPDDHRERLIALGYLREVLGGLTLTDPAQMQLAIGNERRRAGR